MNKRQGKDMKKNIKTTLGVIVAFFVLLKLSNIFTGSSNYEYSESTYSNISENVDEESNYSSQDEEIEQQISTEYNEQIEQEENEEIEETEEEYTYSYTEEEDKNDDNYYEKDYSEKETSYSEKESSVAHIGETAYVTNANSYQQAISNCKYLEGASTRSVTVSNSIGKYECNCWNNPVPYVPKKQESTSQPSSGVYVYISSGNSYYHKSSSCKFLNGASAQKVDKSSVGGKHACNCIKY